MTRSKKKKEIADPFLMKILEITAFDIIELYFSTNLSYHMHYDNLNY